MRIFRTKKINKSKKKMKNKFHFFMNAGKEYYIFVLIEDNIVASNFEAKENQMFSQKKRSDFCAGKEWSPVYCKLKSDKLKEEI